MEGKSIDKQWEFWPADLAIPSDKPDLSPLELFEEARKNQYAYFSFIGNKLRQDRVVSLLLHMEQLAVIH